MLLLTLVVTLTIAASLLARRYLPLLFDSRRDVNVEKTPHSGWRSFLDPLSAQAGCPDCKTLYLSDWVAPAGTAVCAVASVNNLPVPDHRCTPGGINPTITTETLRNPQWHTKCTRGCDTSESQKLIVYNWYGETRDFSEATTQECELDHLIPLELGGSDGLGNIWPMCGTDHSPSRTPYFRSKDRVENYLADQVRSGRISLQEAQSGIATDWTQYVSAAAR